MLDNDYHTISNNIKNEINRIQLEIMKDANVKLVELYFKIGKVIFENYNWGNKFGDNLAMDLKMSFPNLKGFSTRNLNYMKAFYEEYKDDIEILHLSAKLPWRHNITLMQKVKEKNIRKWYMCKCLEEG